MPDESLQGTSMKKISDLINMKGRRALVTGATGGIGRVIAQTLAELGAELVLVDRPGSDYEPIVREIEKLGPVSVLNIDCDLENQSDRNRLIQLILNDGAGLEVLVNNAAFVGTSDLQGWVTPFEQQSVETWRRALEVNLTATFDISKGLSPVLKKSGRGSIINIASIYASLGPDYSLYEGTAMGNPAAFAASKGGLVQLTRWLATTLAPDVRVNTISPGGVFRNQPDAFVKRYESKTPLRRMATENDCKGAIAYLASDLSAYVTGVDLMVDGGWSIW
jgi:NAD(P)-dependent dehydrogenase (short-subunit alcohol dehydrogenase family)